MISNCISVVTSLFFIEQKECEVIVPCGFFTSLLSSEPCKEIRNGLSCPKTINPITISLMVLGISSIALSIIFTHFPKSKYREKFNKDHLLLEATYNGRTVKRNNVELATTIGLTTQDRKAFQKIDGIASYGATSVENFSEKDDGSVEVGKEADDYRILTFADGKKLKQYGCHGYEGTRESFKRGKYVLNTDSKELIFTPYTQKEVLQTILQEFAYLDLPIPKHLYEKCKHLNLSFDEIFPTSLDEISA